MNKLLDLTKYPPFGKLTAIKFVGRKRGNSYWLCECECGSKKEYHLGNLRSGRSTQCKECSEKYNKNYKHGFCKTHTYIVHRSLKARKLLCEEWQDFTNFLNDVGLISEKRFLSRKDRSKLFNKENFIISKQKEPSENNLIYHNGESLTVAEWAKRLKISRQALHQRLKKYPIHLALSFTNRWAIQKGRRKLISNRNIIIN